MTTTRKKSNRRGSRQKQKRTSCERLGQQDIACDSSSSFDILRSLDEGTTDSVVNSLSCRVHVGGRSEAGWTRPTRRGRSIPIENAKIDRVVDRGWMSVVLVVGERPVVKSEAKRSVGLYCRVIVEKLLSTVRVLVPAWFVVTLRVKCSY